MTADREGCRAFGAAMEADVRQIEAALAAWVAKQPRHASLREAMEYSLMAGGKRLRPVLTLATCRLCGGDAEKALPFACGVEMVHTYSLIHDDLPAMDDSDLRRGRQTNHRRFGEAAAILAGDGLLTAAFQVLAEAELPPDRIAEAVRCLAQGAGPAGMAGGQALDLAGEGQTLTLAELEQLQSLKTGALIAAATELGCIAAGCPAPLRQRLARYAASLGRAFQVRDDILDATGSREDLGKPVGGDADRGKCTFVSSLGLEGAYALLTRLTREAREALAEIPEAQFHLWLTDTLAQRGS